MKNFFISSLFAAGVSDLDIDDKELVKLKSSNPLFNQVDNNLNLFFAGHSSHSSHGSHGSHGSHRSSQKKSVPTPTPKITPAPKGNSREKELIVPPVLPKNKESSPILLIKLVQIKLLLEGYYTGEIDGIIGSKTSTAIAKFESKNNLPITGNITIKLLDKLGIEY